jgi:hypothetical protein
MTNEERIEKLEKELALIKRLFVVTPTRIHIKRSLTVDGLLNADRVYTKGSGTHTELTP